MAVEIIEHRRAAPKEKMTFEEYLDWCDEDTWAEWVDGEIIMVSPASVDHQDTGSFLEKVLGIFIEVHTLGKLLRAPFVMRLESLARGREPDLLFVHKDRLHLIQHTYLDGPADMVVEIVSPESIGRDRGEKFVEYERAGVKEYWLIDPERESAEFYELQSNGRYRLASTDEGIYRSKVIAGFWLRVDWLWQTPLPPTIDILKELNVL